MWFLKNLQEELNLRKFNFGELIYFLTLCSLNIFIIYLLKTNKIDFYVGQKMIIYMYFAVFMISLMIIFQFSKIFTAKTSENISLKNIPLILTLILGVVSINNASNFKHIILNDKIASAEHIHQYDIDEYLEFSNSRTVVVDDNNANILDDIAVHPEKYSGYNIIMDGFVCKENYLSKNQFVLGKIVIDCCRADSSIFGIVTEYEGMKNLKENQEIKVEGIIDSTIIYNNGKEHIVPLVIVNKLE